MILMIDPERIADLEAKITQMTAAWHEDAVSSLQGQLHGRRVYLPAGVQPGDCDGPGVAG